MNKKTLNGVLSVLGGKFGGVILTLATTPLLVRILGSGDYGDYAFIMSMSSLIGTFAHAGISGGIRKYIAEDRSDPNWQETVFVYYSRLALSLGFVTVVGLVLFSLFAPIDELLGEGFSTYFILLAITLFIGQISYVSRYTLMGLHLERYSESLFLLKRFLFGVFGLSLAYIGFNVAGVLAGTAIASFVFSVIALWILKNHIDIVMVFRSLPVDVPRRDFLTYNILNTVFIFLSITLYNLDIVLLQPLSGSEQTGFYKSALIIAEFLWIVPQAVQMVFIHSSSELWSKNDYEAISTMASKATRYTLVFMLLLLLGVAALASDFIPLYFGAEFSPAVTPLLLLLPGVLGFGLARPIYGIAQGDGRLRILIIATGFAALLNLILNILLIPRYGMNGAAIATSIGYGSMLVFHGRAARQIGYNPFANLRLKPIFVTSAVSAPVVFGLAFVINGTIASLVIVPPVGFGIYSTLALRTGAVDPEEVVPFLEQAPSSIAHLSTSIIFKIS